MTKVFILSGSTWCFHLFRCDCQNENWSPPQNV